MSPSIEQFDKVRIVALRELRASPFVGSRPPQVGDVATVIDLYHHPLGYELECVSRQGETLWLESFTDEEISLELVGKPKG